MRSCVLFYVQGLLYAVQYRYTFAMMCREQALSSKHHVVRLSSDLFHSMTLGCAQT